MIPRESIVIVAVGFPDVGQGYSGGNHVGKSSPQSAYFGFIVEETFVLIKDSDGPRILNSDGVCVRSDVPCNAKPPNSVHRVIQSRPSPGALQVGFLSVSVLLNTAPSLEKIHRFRSLLIFRYGKSCQYFSI